MMTESDGQRPTHSHRPVSHGALCTNQQRETALCNTPVPAGQSTTGIMGTQASSCTVPGLPHFGRDGDALGASPPRSRRRQTLPEARMRRCKIVAHWDEGSAVKDVLHRTSCWHNVESRALPGHSCGVAATLRYIT